VDEPSQEIALLRKENQDLKDRLRSLEAELAHAEEQGKVRKVAEDAAHSLHRTSIEQDKAQTRKRLEESERRYATLVENLPGMAYRCTKDAPCGFEYVSANASTITGYEPSDLMKSRGIAFADLVHPEDTPTWGKMKKAAEKRRPYQFQYRLRHASGQYKWVWEQGSGVFSPQGDLVAFKGFITDITEYREMEEALRKGEQVFRALVESSPLAIITVTPDGVVTSWNKAAENIFGWSEEEALGRFVPFVPAEKQEESRFWRERIMREGVFPSLEFKRQKKGGEPIHVNISASPFYDARGEAESMMMVIEDITERKKAEEVLRSQKELLQTILDNIPIMVDLLDSEGRVIWMNRALENTLGCAFEEDQSRLDMLAEVYPDPDSLRRVIEIMQKADGTWNDFQMLLRDGSVIDTSWAFLRLSDGTFIGIGQDITQRKRLEAQLIQAQKMESIGRLAGGVAHDFNNLLTPILGYAEMLLYEIPPEHLHYTFLTQIREAAERARNLVRQLLAFSRKQVLHITAVNLNTVISSFEKMLRRMIGEDIQLETALDPSIGPVKADVSQLEQVLLNLAVNARDAMSEGGKLTIETSELYLDEGYAKIKAEVTPGRYIMLAVSDTGQGMDTETLKKIFEPFFTTKDKFKGTGLGLSTVYGIVKQHGGFIYVYSEPGAGSTFKIYLPKAKEDRGEEISPLHQPEIIRREATILILEDDQMVRDLAAAILRQHGYTVLEAENVDHALFYAERHDGPIHLLLSDVVMPNTKGPEAYRGIAVVRPDIKVLYMSGYTDDAVVRYGIIEEGYNYIEKPFTMNRLLEKVNKALEG